MDLLLRFLDKIDNKRIIAEVLELHQVKTGYEPAQDSDLPPAMVAIIGLKPMLPALSAQCFIN